MTGSRAGAVPGRHIASCSASFATATAWASPAAFARSTAWTAIVDDVGVGGVDGPVPHLAGQGGGHLGPQRQRPVLLPEESGGGMQQLEHLGAFAPRPVSQRMKAQRGPGEGDGVTAGAGAPGGFAVPLTGVGSLPGSCEGVGQLEHEGKTVDADGVGVRPAGGGRGGSAAGVVVAQPCGGLPGGEEGVVDRVVFARGRRRRAGVRRSGPRGRSGLQCPPDRQVDRLPGWPGSARRGWSRGRGRG